MALAKGLHRADTPPDTPPASPLTPARGPPLASFLMKRSSHHILLVDDDLGQQFLTQRALKKALSPRSTVHLAKSGREAIAYMMGEGEFADRERHPFPTIVITDLNMPDGDGFDVLEFMQHNPEWAVVPRIMLSSSEDDDDVRTAYFLGASAYHIKHGGVELEACLRRLIEYWAGCQVPPVDETGRLLRTTSHGRCGARYPQLFGSAAMRRPDENAPARQAPRKLVSERR